MIILFTGLIICLGSCKKFLDEKPDQKLTVPTKVQDLQALLENYNVINARMPMAGEASADDYYLNAEVLASIPELTDRNIYTWENAELFNREFNEWTDLYKSVNIANVVLEGLQTIVKSDSDKVNWNTTRGNALFIRSYQFLNAALVWALAYDEATAEHDLGYH